jgi:endo-beta-N-acetylglucosaminidase D
VLVSAPICHVFKFQGTFITENADGEADNLYLLDSQLGIQYYVDKLVNIATYYGFDGWLINIEAMVILSLKVLHTRFLMQNMHKKCASL